VSGITGWVCFERDLTAERTTIEDMTATLARRGPDGGGIWVQPHAAFGHRRLAVPSGGLGDQPLVATSSAGLPVAIVYDGQVYNHASLRAELQRLGHHFRTEGDAEVVLHGYLEWGDDVVRRLTGMYAFAVWDASEQKLILVRDRMGLRPLHYYPLADGVLFGSEPKAILAHPLAAAVVDAEGMCEIFSGFNRTPGAGIWSGMRELRHAGLVTVDASGIRESAYWQLTAEPHAADEETTIATVRELLSGCILEQLPGGEPWCVQLSGGMDSSVLTALASLHAKEHGRTVHTFTVDFTDQDKYFKANLVPENRADTPYAHDVVRLLGTEHTDIMLDPVSLADPAIRRICVEARDNPAGFGDRDMSFYLICQAIKDHALVVFNGDGGGQVVGPYPSSRGQDGERSEPGQPRRIPLPDEALIDEGYLSAIGRDEYLRARTAATMAQAPVLDGEGEMERRIRGYYYLSMIRMPSWATSERRDRLSASAGIEVRTPYYDHRLIQYLFNTPLRMKIFDGREKSLLRAIGADLLPVSVKERKKKGYPGVLDLRYTAELQRQAGELAASGHAALEFHDKRKVAEAVREEPVRVTLAQQFGMERLLDIAAWIDVRKPAFKLP
jgi:asparagine synthase (glutamine-hydrolysing)